MPKVESGVVVTLSFQVTDADGQMVDDGRQPIVYLHGSPEGIFPKIAEALEGKEVGEAIRVTLRPEDAFQARRDELIQIEPRHKFPPDVRVGAQFEGSSDDRSAMLYTVTQVEDDRVVLDANHPLAGLTLIFSAQVAAVRPATPEELGQEQWRPPEA